MRSVAVLAVMALLAGCAQGDETDRVQADRPQTEPPPCNPEQGRPISEATLKAVLARHGIELYRDDRCEHFRDPDAPAPDPNAVPRNPNAPLVTLENIRESDDYDRVASRQGFILCDLERRDQYGGGVVPLKYKDDEETHFKVLNVLCTIYPDSPEQVDALAAALSTLPGAKPGAKG